MPTCWAPPGRARIGLSRARRGSHHFALLGSRPMGISRETAGDWRQHAHHHRRACGTSPRDALDQARSSARHRDDRRALIGDGSPTEHATSLVDPQPGLVTASLITRAGDAVGENYQNAGRSRPEQVAPMVSATLPTFPTISLTGLLGVVSADLAGFTSGTTAWRHRLVSAVVLLGAEQAPGGDERLRTEQTRSPTSRPCSKRWRDSQDALVTAIRYPQGRQVARQAHARRRPCAVHSTGTLRQGRHQLPGGAGIPAPDLRVAALPGRRAQQLLQNHVLLCKAPGRRLAHPGGRMPRT